MNIGDIVQRRYSPEMTCNWFGIIIHENWIAWYTAPDAGRVLHVGTYLTHTYPHFKHRLNDHFVPTALVVKSMEVALCDPLTINSTMLEQLVTNAK